MRNKHCSFEKSNFLFAFTISMLLLSLLPLLPARGQMKAISAEQERVFQEVDTMPMFNGKDAGEFINWMAHEIKYPEEAIKQKIIGNVTVTFIVEKDGSVSNVKVLKSVPILDEEAVRVVTSSPKWTPGIKDGRPVRFSFVLPVSFRTTFPSDEKLRIKG